MIFVTSTNLSDPEQREYIVEWAGVGFPSQDQPVSRATPMSKLLCDADLQGRDAAPAQEDVL